jgi:hypothetical protein
MADAAFIATTLQVILAVAILCTGMLLFPICRNCVEG